MELDRVTKTFGATTAVDALSLAVPTGSIYGFIGPNGSGKTTTLRMIMNILRPDTGVVRVFGHELLSARSARIGYLPEERGLYKRMRVREILRFYGGLKAGHDVKAEVETWIKRLALSEYANHKTDALSKGTSQRVQFAAAVVAQPALLILDEPFTGLDPVNAETLREVILDLRQSGTTVILSTHDMAVAERMCDFIFMIFKGRKVLDGRLTDIQDQYGTDTIRLRADGGATKLRDLPGVEAIRDFGQVQELRITRGTDPQRLLRAVLDRTGVQSFELARPSLHDVFVRIAGPVEKEEAHAKGA